MKVHTGGGDHGKTSLFSGERVTKYHLRVEAYGDLDELNAVLGTLAASLEGDPEEVLALQAEIQGIQSRLFTAGAWLATSAHSPMIEHLEPFTKDEARSLEARIDALQAQLPPLKNFILPGGHFCAGLAHIARTVCRRTERRVFLMVDQADDDQPPDAVAAVIVYLNRLSDYLFMLARQLNRLNGVSDRQWSP